MTPGVVYLSSPCHTNLVCAQLDFAEAVRTQDEPGILRSRDYLNTLIKEQNEKGIPSSRIVLGGFSQGGAMSVFTGLTNKEKLGGVFGLSCYLLLSDRVKNYIPENWPNKNTPFFLAHGRSDDVVKHQFGEKSAQMLKEMGLEDVSFNSYVYVISVWSRPVSMNGTNDWAVTSDTRLTRRKSMTWKSSWKGLSHPRVMVRHLLVYDLMDIILLTWRMHGGYIVCCLDYWSYFAQWHGRKSNCPPRSQRIRSSASLECVHIIIILMHVSRRR